MSTVKPRNTLLNKSHPGVIAVYLRFSSHCAIKTANKSSVCQGLFIHHYLKVKSFLIYTDLLHYWPCLAALWVLWDIACKGYAKKLNVNLPRGMRRKRRNVCQSDGLDEKCSTYGWRTALMYDSVPAIATPSWGGDAEWVLQLRQTKQEKKINDKFTHK